MDFVKFLKLAIKPGCFHNFFVKYDMHGNSGHVLELEINEQLFEIPGVGARSR